MSDTESNLHWGWLGLARETNITAIHVPGSTLPQYSNPLACFQYHGQYRGTKYFAMDGLMVQQGVVTYMSCVEAGSKLNQVVKDLFESRSRDQSQAIKHTFFR